MIPSQPFECNSKNPFPPSSILSSTSAKPPILSSFPGFIHVPYFPTTNNNNKSNTKNITETLFHEDLTIRCSTTPNVERSSSSDTITTTRPRSNNNYFRNDSNINETKENHVSSESSDESSSSSGHGDSHTEMNQSNNSEPLITPVKTKRRRKKKKGLYCYQSYLDCQRKEKKLRTITENEEQSLLHDLNLIFYPNHSHHDEIMNFPKYPKVNYAQKLVNTTELARIRAKLVVRQRKRSKQINLKDLNEESTNFDLEQFTRNWALSKHSNYFKTHCVNNTTIPSNLLKNSNSSMNDLPTTTTSSNSELVPANNNNTTTSTTTNTHQPETISIYPQTLPKSKIIPKILPKPLMQSKTASMTSPFAIPQRNRIQNIIGNNKTSTSSYPQGSKIPTNAFPFMPIPSMFQFSSQPSPLTSLARSHHSSPSHYYAFTQPPRPLPSHYVVVESQHSYDSTTSQNKEPSTMMATGERMMMHSNITEEEIQSADLTNYKVNIAVRADIDITTVADHIDHIPSNKDSIMLFTEHVNSTEGIKISNFREKLLGKELNFNGKVGSLIARLKDESACKRIQLFKELVMKIQEKSTQSTHFSSSHVYFKHIEEDFVVQTNSLLCRCFWPNIDISIYLKQPQYTIVALYNHLVIGFGAVCPQTGYIHYLLTHPHWRNCGIGSFMISYLISQYSKQSSNSPRNGNPSNVSQEITIHVPKTDLRVIQFLKKLNFTAKTVHEGFFSQLVTPSDDNDNNAAPTTNILDFLKDKSFDALLMARSFHIVINK